MAMTNTKLCKEGVKLTGLMAEVVLDMARDDAIDVELVNEGGKLLFGNVVKLSHRDVVEVVHEMAVRFEAGRPCKCERDIAGIASDIRKLGLLVDWVADSKNYYKRLVFA